MKQQAGGALTHEVQDGNEDGGETAIDGQVRAGPGKVVGRDLVHARGTLLEDHLELRREHEQRAEHGAHHGVHHQEEDGLHMHRWVSEHICSDLSSQIHSML